MAFWCSVSSSTHTTLTHDRCLVWLQLLHCCTKRTANRDSGSIEPHVLMIVRRSNARLNLAFITPTAIWTGRRRSCPLTAARARLKLDPITLQLVKLREVAKFRQQGALLGSATGKPRGSGWDSGRTKLPYPRAPPMPSDAE